MDTTLRQAFDLLGQSRDMLRRHRLSQTDNDAARLDRSICFFLATWARSRDTDEGCTVAASALHDLVVENDNYGGCPPSSPVWDVARAVQQETQR